MKANKIVKALTLAAGLLAGNALFAVGSIGDICEVRPCDQFGRTVEYKQTDGTVIGYDVKEGGPLTSGRDLYFLVRLIAKEEAPADWNSVTWNLTYNGAPPPDSNWSYPTIKIFVSGQPVEATFVKQQFPRMDGASYDSSPNSSGYTDLVFKYRTQAGDFAMPIEFAVWDSASSSYKPSSAMGTSEVGISLPMNWAITTPTGGTPNLSIYAADENPVEEVLGLTPDNKRNIDYTLSSCGFVVKTIDFDNEWEAEPTVWRTVHEGSEDIDNGGNRPSITGVAPLAAATTMYIWSTEESAVKVTGPNMTVKDITFPTAAGTKGTAVQRQVAKVTIAGGKISENFSIEGVTEGGNAKLVLSPWPDYRYTKLNAIVNDFSEVPVRCSGALPLAVVVKSSPAIVEANSEALVAVSDLKIELTKTCDTDIKFTIEPVFTATDLPIPGVTWGDYIRIDNNSVIEALPTASPLEITIKAGNKYPDLNHYIFALRSDANVNTIANQMRFRVSSTDAASIAAIPALATATDQGALRINARKPVVTWMFNETSTATTAVDADLALKIKVADIYADTLPASGGYEIWINKDTDATADFEQIKGLYTIGYDGTLFKAGSGDKVRPVAVFTEPGEPVHAAIRVVSPISKLTSDDFPFDVTVTIPAGYTVDTIGGVKEVNEGDSLSLRITLDTPNTIGDIYAYLKPRNTASENAVSCSWLAGNNAAGQPCSGICLNKFDSVLDSGCDIKIIDGAADLGSTLEYDVVFCTTATYDETQPVKQYRKKNILRITSHNVIPSVDRVTMNKSSKTQAKDGETISKKVPIEVEQKFTIKVIEPGTYDKTITEPGKMFRTRWYFSDEYDSYPPISAKKISTGEDLPIVDNVIEWDPDDIECVFDFPNPGLYEITVDVGDKDMGNDFGNGEIDQYFTCYVEAVDNPVIDVVPNYTEGRTRFMETDSGTSFGICPQINNCTQPLIATVEINVPALTTKRMTLVETGDETKPKLGYVKLLDEATGTYEVAIPPRATEYTVYITDNTMDGTVQTLSSGYSISVSLPEEKNNWVVPDSGGKLAYEYYVGLTGHVKVENVAPQITYLSPMPSTNHIAAAIGDAQRAITWGFTDVDGDFELGNPAGVRVRVIGAGNDFEEYVTDSGKAADMSFTPNFPAPGVYTVQLMITDKDHGEAVYRTTSGEALEMIWYYEVEPSKMLETMASGPSGGRVSALSSKYKNAAGRGEGHVYAQNVALSDSGDFNFTWNCQKENLATVFAYGYKYNPAGTGTADDGTLNNGKDVAINPTGKACTPAEIAAKNFYVYNPDDGRDSFLYAWLLTTRSENNMFTSTFLGGGLAMEDWAGAAARGTVPLPSDRNDDGSYNMTMVEAVFSKEWRVADNCGDMNFDGIPDLYLARYGLGIYDTAAGADNTGMDDRVSAATYNGDEDYLPGNVTAGLGTAPNTSGSWARESMAFNAKREIRGWHDGLNAGYKNPDGSYPYPDYSYDEMRAWLLFREIPAFVDERATLRYINKDANEKVAEIFEANKEAARDDLVAWIRSEGKEGWSPERPTDPMEADTDGDACPDGYEYWFWYRARVGYHAFDNNNNEYWAGPLTGRRLQFPDYEKMQEIPAEGEGGITALFDPQVAREDYMKDDTDADGLFDYEEFLIGSNPIDCDTGSKGYSDGYAVMWGLNPATGGADNPDGDWMAFASAFLWEVEDEGGEVKQYVLNTTEEEFRNKKLKAKQRQDELNAALEEGEDPILLTIKFKGYPVEDKRTVGGNEIPSGTIDPRIYKVFEFGVEALDPEPDKTIKLIHEQVYLVFGFDPRVAWSGYPNSGCVHGYLTTRWCLNCNSTNPHVALLGDAGKVTHTTEYTTKMEYLLGKYRNQGKQGNETVFEYFKRCCTNPNKTFDGVTYGDYQTTFASGTHGADTDGDGMPDGWELYVGIVDPDLGGRRSCDPLEPRDGGIYNDEDSLPNSAEYAGSDSCRVYAECEHIVNRNPANQGWVNKFFPTDPNNFDSDGDGIDDSAEGAGWRAKMWVGRASKDGCLFTFIYGNPQDDHSTVCCRGGGMNPCNVDTDFDCIPDAWEYQYAGLVYGTEMSLYSTELRLADGILTATGEVTPQSLYIWGGMDATFATDAASTPATEPNDSATGTIRDFDFDHDGLENFQEYLIQSVRAWRYDDVDTPLMGRAIYWEQDGMGFNCNPVVTSAEDAEYIPMNMHSGADMLTAVKGSEKLGAALAEKPFYTEADAAYDYQMLGYFAPCENEWDPMNQYAMSPTINYTYDSGREVGFTYMRKPNIVTRVSFAPAIPPIYPVDRYVKTFGNAMGYFTTDPRQWDTDQDGMDDYWEVYHGLNPILGTVDVIQEGGSPFTANNNLWFAAYGANPGLDFVLAPWLAGLSTVDPDGDGIRNVDESINGNLTSPTTYHTDPSPLWMTDKSSVFSYTSQYYPVPGELAAYAWPFLSDPQSETQYLYSFEENEGYDTDSDWRGDGHELVKGVMDQSDPLNPNDPDRRNAIYLDGNESCACSVFEGNVFIDDAFDMFRQFTVECWIKPDSVDHEQTIFERGSVYDGTNLTNPDSQWRVNFRLAIDKDGCVYGTFDNDNAVESGSTIGALSSQFVKADKPIAAGEWTHVAMTFDGLYLRLYLNGVERAFAKSILIPANGVVAILQNPDNTDKYPMASYEAMPGANVIGAHRHSPIFLPAMGIPGMFQDFYTGYISEVRVWDGARTVAEIRSTYKTRLTNADIDANRKEVFSAWYNGATRNDNDGNDMLPAQLMALWNFQTLPSAVDSGDVAKIPSGFDLGVLANCLVDGATPEEANVGWWNVEWEPIHSTVYTDYHVVPWIQNAVSHLPYLSGSVQDSMYWSNLFAGYIPASANDVSSYLIPNGGNPYKGRCWGNEDEMHEWRLGHVSGVVANAALAEKKVAFKRRSEFVGLDDLVPLGNAYAKRLSDFWDGQGPTTVWTDTGVDSDGDDLPDWWEALYGNPNPTDIVDYNGMKIPASEAYIRDLAAGVLPSTQGQGDPDFVDQEDKGFDGIPDWWAQIYGISTAGDEDDDLDGLSNFTEYLLSEVFELYDADGKRARFSPVNPNSVNEFDSDYFFKVGQLYAGEIFTDHDMMEDWWEKRYNVDFVSRYKWDATSDNDGDRWSAFSEARYSMFTTDLRADKSSYMLDDSEIRGFPTPTIKLTVRYNGSQPITTGAAGGNGNNNAEAGNTLAPLVVKTYSHKGLQDDDIVADATFNVQPGSTVDRNLYLGAYSPRLIRGTLNPGHVRGDSFGIEFYPLPQNEVYTWSVTDEETGETRYGGGTYEAYMEIYNTYGPTAVQLTSSEPGWMSFEDGAAFRITRDGDSEDGYITFQGKRVGEINLTSGRFSLDMTDAQNWLIGNDTNGVVALAASAVRLTYQSILPILQYNKMDLYLGVADVGAVREGKNDIIAFYDLDGDGEYTPGEPMGFAKGVDVGWFEGAAEIEMTDTSPIITRADLTSGVSDRKVLYGTEDGDHDAAGSTGIIPGDKYVRIRVVRSRFNNLNIIADEVLVDKQFNLDQRKFLYEGDVLGEDGFDVDWANLATTIANNTTLRSTVITSVTYRIVFGNGVLKPGGTGDNLFSIISTRYFDATQATPDPVAPKDIIYGSRPVFKWTMPNNRNTYTAFNVQILDGSKTVWDSGVRRAPARDADGVYTFVPDVYAGAELQPNKKYTWRVSMYNSKFRTSSYSASQTFAMDTLQNSYDYGSINVCVKYFGPANVLSGGTVYVEAFDNPDFSGIPVGRAIATDKTAIAAVGVEHEANAKIIGLPKGTYYVRAFIDNTKGTAGKRDAWESWGYVCPREVRNKYMFSPTSIVIGDQKAVGDTFTCYIEDCDTNGNNLPDAWEWVKNSGSLDKGTENLDWTSDSGVMINNALAGSLSAKQGDGTPSSGLAAYAYSVIKTAGVALLIADVDVPANTENYAVLAAGTDVNAVKITDMAIEGGKVSVSFEVNPDEIAEGTVKKAASVTASTIYTVSPDAAGTVTVPAHIEYTDDLAKGWSKGETFDLTVDRATGKGGSSDFSVEKYIPAGAKTFLFKIVLEK